MRVYMSISAISEQLKKKRNLKRINLSEVSKAIGVDVGQLSRIERGKCRYLSKNLIKYCKYLGVHHDVNSEEALLLCRIEKLMQRSSHNTDVFRTLIVALENLSGSNS